MYVIFIGDIIQFFLLDVKSLHIELIKLGRHVVTIGENTDVRSRGMHLFSKFHKFDINKYECSMDENDIFYIVMIRNPEIGVTEEIVKSYIQLMHEMSIMM